MGSPGQDPAGAISWDPARGMRRPRPDRLLEIQKAMSVVIRFVSDLKKDRVSEMAEGAAPLTWGFSSQAYSFYCCMLLGGWIRRLSPSLPCSPNDRITSHRSSLWARTIIPRCSGHR